MELITNSVVPDRWRNSRIPPDGAEMQSTNILRVKVVSVSGKTRDGECTLRCAKPLFVFSHANHWTGGPHDEAKDTKREDVTSSTWVGVIPVVEVMKEPVPAECNKVGQLPEYISSYVAEANSNAEDFALKAARLP